MPSTSAAQKRTMRAAAHNAEFARKVGIPQSVAREFYRADKRAERRDKTRQAIAKVRQKPR